MFEKEAEKYFETECLHSYADTEEQLKEDVVPAFQKGAEFGYNKANEWHYIKDKDFPNTKGEYLVCRSKSKYSILAFDGSFWITGVHDDPYDHIIAWKEIELPKELENV